MKTHTLVLGASLKTNRYSNIAIQRLRANHYSVKAIGSQSGTILDVEIDTDKQKYSTIDTVTLYLNPKRQEEYYDYIISLQPRRVIFNPGTENEYFEKMLKSYDIKVEVACTLVLISLDQY